MHTQILDVPADAIELARRLRAAALPMVALLPASSPVMPPRNWYLAALPDRRIDAFAPPVAAEPRQVHGAVPRWLGLVPYDAMRHLERPGWVRPDRRPPAELADASWWRYPAVVVVDEGAGRVEVVGDSKAAVAALSAACDQPPGPTEAVAWVVRDADPPAAHRDRVARAIERIAAGDLYQVNLARRLDVELRAGGLLDVFAAMSRAAPSAFGQVRALPSEAAVVSTSPELLLDAEPLGVHPPGAPIDRWRLVSAPIKGTRPRGGDNAEDARLRAELDADPKERAELAMIIDVVRNDLGRLCLPGTVEVSHPAHVVTHATVHHRQATVQGCTRDGIDAATLVRELLPSGSVTGAPKVRAMEVIRQLEAHRRGLYTGALGVVTRAGRLTLAMAIRTLVLRGRRGSYFTGGGVVIDSDPERELLETHWKAVQLTRLAATS